MGVVPVEIALKVDKPNGLSTFNAIHEHEVGYKF